MPATVTADRGRTSEADAYAGYDRLYEKGENIEVGCWAHARRKRLASAPLICDWLAVR